MTKWVCQICGYVYEGEELPADYRCPVCKAPAAKFTKQAGEMTWAAEHVVGIAKDVPEEIKEGLRENFNGECSEVGMYLAMSRQAFREGYPEVGMYYEKAAYEEAEHAAKFAELLGEVLDLHYLGLLVGGRGVDFYAVFKIIGVYSEFETHLRRAGI